MKVRLIFRWYDFWVGLYWDRVRRELYVFPVPMVGFWIRFTFPMPDLLQRIRLVRRWESPSHFVTWKVWLWHTWQYRYGGDRWRLIYYYRIAGLEFEFHGKWIDKVTP